MNTAFLGIAALAKKDGVSNIVETQADGFYRRSFGQWSVALNGTPEPRENKGSMIPAYTAYLEYNGWPAGLIDPSGGIIAAGEAANEDTFIAAIEAEIGGDIERYFKE